MKQTPPRLNYARPVFRERTIISLIRNVMPIAVALAAVLLTVLTIFG